jgi:hypothetical protein
MLDRPMRLQAKLEEMQLAIDSVEALYVGEVIVVGGCKDNRSPKITHLSQDACSILVKC